MDTREHSIRHFIDPSSGQAIFAKARIEEEETVTRITVGYPCRRETARLERQLGASLTEQGFATRAIRIVSEITTHRVQGGLKPLAGVKNLVAVASGKGGVGKSTISVNLAIALQQQGAAVGLLDADIYGPSQAKMLGGAQRPLSTDGKTMEPVIRHGLQTLSMADLIDEETAMIWRGPMVTQTLIQLLNESRWHALDYLVIDLPPGTGDTQLTLAQQIPVTGAIIVTTPQDIALLDAKKAKIMFDKVRIPTLGLIENMSVYHCPNCGHTAHIFGEGGGEKLARRYKIPLLGSLPLDIRFRENSDRGTALGEKEADADLAAIYHHIAFAVGYELSGQEKSYTRSFPEIVIEK